ncbi:MAG TPA: hypothetical protein VF523_17100 [Burkholderiales bacterium]
MGAGAIFVKLAGVEEMMTKTNDLKEPKPEGGQRQAWHESKAVGQPKFGKAFVQRG